MAKFRMPAKRPSAPGGRGGRAPRKVVGHRAPSISVGQTIAGVIGWAGAGGFLCLLIFLSVNMGRRTSKLDEEAKELTATYKVENDAQHARRTEELARMEEILQKERQKQFEADTAQKEAARELSTLQKKTRSQRKKLNAQLKRALAGVDLEELLGDGQELSDLAPADILAALEAHKEALTTELEELKGIAENEIAAAQDVAAPGENPDDWRPRDPRADAPAGPRQKVDPEKVKLSASVRSVDQRATADTPARRILEGELRAQNLDTAAALRNLKLEYIVYGRHLTRDDAFVLYFRDVKTFDLPAGASIDLRFNPVYLGRDPQDPTHLDARYDGYVAILRDEAGNVIRISANQPTFRDVDTTGWESLGKADIFDLRLGRTGRVPTD